MRTVAQPLEEVQPILPAEGLGAIEEFFGWLEGRVREGVRQVIEGAVAQEFRAFIGVAPWERGAARRAYRNGSRRRSFLCRLGLIRGIRVPRSRQGGFESRVLPRAQRKERWITSLVADVFLRGVSTRKVKALGKRLWGQGPSASAVSQMNRSLRQELVAWLNRPLAKPLAYLILDAVNLPVRRQTVAKEALLCAVGFTAQGEREFLGFLLGGRESTSSWEDFLLHLKRRGLDPAPLQLITVDGNPGNLKALATVFPGVRVQRCLVHKLWNLDAKCPRTLKGVVGAEARRIFHATSEQEARERFQAWQARWATQVPAVVECLEKDLEACLAFYTQPYRRWKKIRSTNMIERCFREFRRRIQAMDSFPTEESGLRILFGLAKMLNEHWAGQPIKGF